MQVHTLSLRLKFSIVPPSEASPIRVKLFVLSVDIILKNTKSSLKYSEENKYLNTLLSYKYGDNFRPLHDL